MEQAAICRRPCSLLKPSQPQPEPWTPTDTAVSFSLNFSKEPKSRLMASSSSPGERREKWQLSAGGPQERHCDHPLARHQESATSERPRAGDRQPQASSRLLRRRLQAQRDSAEPSTAWPRHGAQSSGRACLTGQAGPHPLCALHREEGIWGLSVSTAAGQPPCLQLTLA